MPTYYFKSLDLEDYILRYFTHFGVPAADAHLAADVLLSADARGVDSHGIIRLSSYYGARLHQGLIDPLSPMKIIRESSTSLSVDGGNGLGHPVSVKTMRLVIEKARTAGMAMATVRNSNHYGIAGYYAMMALPEEMIGICFTNSGPLVAPTYGRKAMLGTNPIAVAVPAGQQRPFVLDMATSIVPIGRVAVYQKENKPIPAGWGINKTGDVTEEPGEVINGGALMPLGGTALMRGYKGYGLALMVDIICGVLAGGGFADRVYGAGATQPADVGHFFAAIRIDAFREMNVFKQDMDALLSTLKDSPRAAGEERIYIHGEKEFENADRAASEGIPLSQAAVTTLEKAGIEYGVPFDLKPLQTR